MPVLTDEREATDHKACGSSKTNRQSKQSTINALFKKSVKKAKRSISPSKEENENKKKRTNGDIKEKNTSFLTSSEKPGMKTVEKCKECRQLLNSNDIKLFQGDHSDALEEFAMLVDPRLSLLSGNEQDFDTYEDRPQHKVTEFSVYDKCGHLCAFDTGLIEKNVELFFSGYVKPIFDENPDIEGGISTKAMGPINEWWIAGFDGGENALIGFGTAFAEYILMRPSDDYASFMNAVTEKIYMSKIVIEFLLNNHDSEYEELLNKLETTVPPENCAKFTEDTLLQHAQFLVEQVESYDSAALDEEDSPRLITSCCMRDLIKLAGVTLGKRRQMRGLKVKEEKKTLGPTLATTTPLVRHVFDTFFKNQIDLKGVTTQRRKRCGVCEICQQPDCGVCRSCKDMVKFGGSGRSKQCCINRRCPNLAVQEAEEDALCSQDEDEPMLKSPSKTDISPRHHRKGQEKKSFVKWACEDFVERKGKKLYKSVQINNELINVGEFVQVYPTDPSDPLYICRVMYMWEDLNGDKKFHAQWLYRSSETVLGEVGDPSEVFLSDDCDDIKLGAIMSKCNVSSKFASENWFLEGGKEGCIVSEENNELFYQKWYDYEDGLFTDPPTEFLFSKFDEKYCPSCERTKTKLKYKQPTLGDELQTESSTKSEHCFKTVTWQGVCYSLGDCVYLDPDAFTFKIKQKSEPPKSKSVVKDEDEYPELYRKSNDYIKGSNINIAEPFRIGKIISIIKKTDNYGGMKSIMLKVRKFYRPENTHKGMSGTMNCDLNMVYWSNEEATVDFQMVEGKCYVLFADDADMDMFKFTEAGPDRFYFREAYDADKKEFDVPPREAWNSNKGKGKGKSKSTKQQNELESNFPAYEKVEKLRTLDIFAGCGGLSEGFDQVGVVNSCWAIEFEPSAAQAYRLNNPSAIVFNQDCNNVLKQIMEGKEKDDLGQRLPRRGEVDLLCGGPPCQGFSGMNRFNQREYSMFKNSLVTSYLSYCDYFRPKFFILENVRNFVSFKKSMVLKLTLSCLVKMGYQCEFGVLQAGSYGVPQTRRRAIIIAAAPGEVLPKFPEPQHVFASKALSLSVTINSHKYQALKRLHSAPYRTTTVYDAMSDLPEIKNGANKMEIGYDTEPLTHFQKKIRGKHMQVLRDHICKDMSPLVEARMSYIPCIPGSDWRDLPNKVVKLRDGNTTKLLLYLHKDKKQGPGKNGENRGVCACANGKPCDPSDRQFNTLIPWCLPHTGNRHNNWAGLYGRLEWDGFFSTTVTNPEPMGKQGRVLHPEQHRVVSVRECSRSQGFPDSFRFYGNILDKHRQIGNAVAPPMSAAIGQEIRKSIIAKKLRNEQLQSIKEENKHIAIF
ncbi:DNA (cytosine-5)-methyltransferase PliMCI isoform X3 [Hydra vulgaris]|uniref:DNA (cytosine-5)-methyltransferase n=1 Tax=Hydra vulgaris TaxID=6087 RepID=A0ABM4BEM5_HYDVU